MKRLRIGMIVPSLNTIAEDDFRMYCPPGVAYHVHRLRLRKENGVVTEESLTRAHLEAAEEAEYLKDMSPDVIAFNCTGASIAYGKDCDTRLAERMTEVLGVPSTNTMVAVKDALRAVGARRILQVCPFGDAFLRIEAQSLADASLDVHRSVSLNFTDAKVAARMEPCEIVDRVLQLIDHGTESVFLSCANVRAFEAVRELERTLDMPVVTSNQAMLWGALRLAGWQGAIDGAGRLFADARAVA
ncbi:maleate cis-trans isomerase family protein [Burkholderia sp. WSM2230]|uniref:maleate cis-trans isomerase family protein n=1 Tax=Burkholderia sp. WSM2230 TaxID=944435 RepID=UPI000428A8BD|nr:aspartate/glutamate racemase family protein [Burkholderia sp. WSM2230]